MSKINSKKKVIYGVGLAAAMLALLLDRFLSPAPADARSPSAAAASASADVAASAPAPGPPIASIFATDALDGPPKAHWPWQRKGTVRDLFAPSRELQNHYRKQIIEQQKVQQEQALAKQEEARQTIDAFQSNHRLAGTMDGPKGRLAIIDGQIYQAGDALDGFTLDSVEDYRVVFKQDDVAAILQLPFAAQSQVPSVDGR
jgi:Spy/CpxP family protein refolding chaperone